MSDAELLRLCGLPEKSTAEIIELLCVAERLLGPSRILKWERQKTAAVMLCTAMNETAGGTEITRDALVANLARLGKRVVGQDFDARRALVVCAQVDDSSWKCSTTDGVVFLKALPDGTLQAYNFAKSILAAEQGMAQGDRAAPHRRGRLNKADSDAKRLSMLALVSQHPSLANAIPTLAALVGVGVSTARRWLDAEQKKFQESKAANSPPRGK